MAANLRPAVASVGPELVAIRRSLELSAAGAAALTTLPVVCFGVLAPLAPPLAARLGIRRAVGLASVAVAVGLAVRLMAGVTGLFLGTVLAAGGIATANVLLPALIKREFPHRTGLLMGLYATALTGAAAVAAGVTVPLADVIGHSWRGGLGIWAVPAVAAVMAWVPQLRSGPPVPLGRAQRPGPLLADRLAWQVTGYLGLQSLSFYAILSWLPTLYIDHGSSATRAGLLLSIWALIQTVVGLFVPVWAVRVADQRAVVAVGGLAAAAGLLGVTLAPVGAAYLWVALLGVGQGVAFPAALVLLVLRTRNERTTAALSAMAQTVGYLIAGLGPLVVGALRAASGSWTVPMALLTALLIPQLAAGLAAGRAGFVSHQPG